eukprot:gene9357-19409_t
MKRFGNSITQCVAINTLKQKPRDSMIIPPQTSAQIGLIAPKMSLFGSTVSINVAGNQAIAATIMAIREINNKTDGIADDILPNTLLKLAFRSPRLDFLKAIKAALDFTSSAFNGTGILGMIGTAGSEPSKATSEVFTHTPYKVPQISYGGQSSDLGHSVYSNFFRTCPSDAYEGRIIPASLENILDDTFGNDIFLEFEGEAAIQGITIESRYSFWPGIKDFSSKISVLIKYDFNQKPKQCDGNSSTVPNKHDSLKFLNGFYRQR